MLRQLHSNLLRAFPAAAFALAILATSIVHAQNPPSAQPQDTSVLKPPPGARVAIVEFGDLECPFCGNINPTITGAAAKYKIPLVRHDFPLPMHPWAFQAAVDARWFDTQSKQLGDEYRDAVFANQSSIYNVGTLRQFTEHFAADHKLQLPMTVDPQGKLADEVKADQALGLKLGVHLTPTIWVVANPTRGAPHTEVKDPARDLYTTIDQAIADSKPESKAAPKPAVKPGK